MNNDSMSTRESGSLSAAIRFALAALCCGVFVITVLLLVHSTGREPLSGLRHVALTFWGVAINFALCLAVVGYVSRRLHKADPIKTVSK